MNPTDEELRKAWNELNKERTTGGTKFVSFLYLRPDVKSAEEHIYAMRFGKKITKPTYAECERVLPGKSYVSRNLNFYYSQGYSYFWGERAKGFYSANHKIAKPWCEPINWEAEIRKEPRFAYIDVKQFAQTFLTSIVRGIETLYAYTHECEMMIKSGHPELMRDRRWLKLPYRDFTRLIQYGVRSYSLALFKEKQGIKEPNRFDLDDYFRFKNLRDAIGGNVSLYFEVMRYVKKQGTDLDEYIRYISEMKGTGVTSFSHSALFPSHLATALESAEKMSDKAKNKAFDRSLSTISKSVNPPSSERFAPIIPKSVHEFFKFSKALNNCIYRSQYYAKMANRSDVIVIIADRKNRNTPVACLEVAKGNGRVEAQQLYMKDDAIPTSEVKNYAKRTIVPYFRSYEFASEAKGT